MEYELLLRIAGGHCGLRDVAWKRFSVNKTFCAVPRVGDQLYLYADMDEDFPEQIREYLLWCKVTNVIWVLDKLDDDDEYTHAIIDLIVEGNMLN